MDFPPLDDTRWDRLLDAVVGQRPTVGDPDAPLASSFPAPPVTDDGAPLEHEDEDVHDLIDLDTYA